jgi:hypothetical protein
VRVRRQVPALTSHSFTYIGDVRASMAWGQLVMVSEVGRQVPALTSHSFTYIRDVRTSTAWGQLVVVSEGHCEKWAYKNFFF